MRRFSWAYLLATTILGAFVLIFLSILQKAYLGVPIATLSGYYVPGLFGGATGLVYGYFSLQKSRRIHRLEDEIAARKATEAELRRFKQAAEAAGHAVYLTDTDGVIEYVNPAFEEITGYPAAEAIGKTPRILQSGEMGADYYEELWETVLAGEVWEEAVRNRRKNGERYYAHQTIAPITDDGECQAFVAIQTDVTDRKQLQERLSVLNRILRHDIRSAVSIIRGNARLGKAGESDMSAVLDTIETEAETLYSLSENAREVERIVSADPARTERIELTELLEAKLFHFENTNPKATFGLHRSDPVAVEASPRIGQAIDQVLTNAIDHCDRDHPQITVDLDVDGPESEWVEIVVADNGPGIPADEIAPLEAGFETELRHTSGLGLWIVKWIVEASDGTVAFEDRDPRGTRVRLRLRRVS